MTTAADARVNSWAKLTRIPGQWHRCESGGFLVETGDAFPAWRADMGAVRSLLLELDLAAPDALASAP